ncbi:IclR family transcriptional regulator [Pseudomonas typographi]|uniref:IclR family transcriptional regulator n=1 Tax=Pseudomonas typographi TaxID=2715964 RepID=UPI0016883768|nr:IclR family transcriptional regulator [Pseudomonas typographi]MBD1551457.1 IclR family transcriptional regulator [Pseudomonas typographi]MBD1587557.1 IclR family transcriptional regulator [Pseudomonas typographi]
MDDSNTRSGKPGATKDVGAVVNAIQILRHLSRSGAPEGVAAIARGTGISPSSAFNILRTLANEQWVAFDEQRKTYQLGLGLSELAVSFIGYSYADLIQPELERVSINHRILVILWQVTGDNHITAIARALPNAAHVDVRLQTRLPELVGASGRCIAALRDLPQSELRRRFARLHWENPPTFETYQQEAALARERGWAVEEGNLYRGVSLASAAVADQHGQPRFVLSGIAISAQHDRPQLEAIGEALSQTAQFIGRALFPLQRSDE